MILKALQFKKIILEIIFSYVYKIKSSTGKSLTRSQNRRLFVVRWEFLQFQQSVRSKYVSFEGEPRPCSSDGRASFKRSRVGATLVMVLIRELSVMVLIRELSPLKKGEVSVRLTSLYLLVRNQLFQEELKIIFFIFKTT